VVAIFAAAAVIAAASVANVFTVLAALVAGAGHAHGVAFAAIANDLDLLLADFQLAASAVAAVAAAIAAAVAVARAAVAAAAIAGCGRLGPKAHEG
jgi:hypothetical protein